MSQRVQYIIHEVMRQSGILVTTDDSVMRLMMGFGYFMGMEAFYSNPDKQAASQLAIFRPPHADALVKTETIGIMSRGTPFQPFPMGISYERFMSLLFHELAHATGRAGRLNRTSIMDNDRSRVDQAVEELIAEQSAIALLAHFGISTTETAGKSMEYLEIYLRMIPEEQQEYFAAWALRESEKAVAYILQNWVVGINFAREAA